MSKHSSKDTLTNKEKVERVRDLESRIPNLVRMGETARDPSSRMTSDSVIVILKELLEAFKLDIVHCENITKEFPFNGISIIIYSSDFTEGNIIPVALIGNGDTGSNTARVYKMALDRLTKDSDEFNSFIESMFDTSDKRLNELLKKKSPITVLEEFFGEFIKKKGL